MNKHTATFFVAVFMIFGMMKGMPALHGLESGKDFGRAVSNVAHIYPGAVADHVSN